MLLLKYKKTLQLFKMQGLIIIGGLDGHNKKHSKYQYKKRVNVQVFRDGCYWGPF